MMHMPNEESGKPLTAQINVKMTPELKAALLSFYEATRIPPGDLMRGLAEMAVDYLGSTGEFSFPGLQLIKNRTLPQGSIKQPRTTAELAQKSAMNRLAAMPMTTGDSGIDSGLGGLGLVNASGGKAPRPPRTKTRGKPVKKTS